MKDLKFLFSEGSHKWGVTFKDNELPDHIIGTNEYIIGSADEYIIADPGGFEVFPAVFAAISRHFDPKKIHSLFSSHQDPDIISSLSLWYQINPDIKVYTSYMWSTFIPHFGGDQNTFIKIPDEGQIIKVGGIDLVAFPAHYLHSSGNFHLYDEKAKIFFSGDVGSALIPEKDRTHIFVENFDEHIKLAEGFHKRWMGSNHAKKNWIERVSKLDIDMLCPQHGLIYKGEDVQRFISWFDELKVGII